MRANLVRILEAWRTASSVVLIVLLIISFLSPSGPEPWLTLAVLALLVSFICHITAENIRHT